MATPQSEVHGRWRQRIETHRLLVPTRLDATEVGDAASFTSAGWAGQVRLCLDEALRAGLLVCGVWAEAAAGSTPVIEVFVAPDLSPRDRSIELGMPTPLGIVSSLRAW